MAFCKDLIAHLIGNNAEKIIKKITHLITEDSKSAGSSQLFRIAFDISTPEAGDGEKKTNFLNDKKYWSFRRQLTVENMITCFNTSNDKKTDKFKLLNEFFTKLNELQSLSYLPDICKMLSLLYLTFNRQVDREYAKSIKIGDLIEGNELFSEYGAKKIIQTGCEAFLKAWCQLSQTLSNKFDRKISQRLDFKNPILIEQDYKLLPLSYLLPSTFNDGRYIYSLLFFMINSQNEFMEFYQKTQANQAHIEPIELSALTASNCISFTIEKDLLQIVYMSSNYSYESNSEINLQYDFNKIQLIVIKKFLEEKCLIQLNVSILKVFFFKF